MFKNYFIYTGLVLFIFCSGFLIGHKVNENGRYQTTDMSLTTDTKNGILYIFRGTDFIVINLKTGERKIMSIKKLKNDNEGFSEQNLYKNLLEQ